MFGYGSLAPDYNESEINDERVTLTKPIRPPCAGAFPNSERLVAGDVTTAIAAPVSDVLAYPDARVAELQAEIDALVALPIGKK